MKGECNGLVVIDAPLPLDIEFHYALEQHAFSSKGDRPSRSNENVLNVHRSLHRWIYVTQNYLRHVFCRYNNNNNILNIYLQWKFFHKINSEYSITAHFQVNLELCCLSHSLAHISTLRTTWIECNIQESLNNQKPHEINRQIYICYIQICIENLHTRFFSLPLKLLVMQSTRKYFKAINIRIIYI